METQTTTPVDPSKVKSVYSGQAGKCACGCKGKYRYAKATQVEAGKSRGYEVTDDECSDRSVKIIVGKVNAQMAAGAKVMAADSGQYVTVDVGERVYTVYFN